MSGPFCLSGVSVRAKSAERNSAARKAILSAIGVAFLLGIMPSLSVHAQGNDETSVPVYDFSIETAWLKMKDGVRLSATFFKPISTGSGEGFPVLFEFLPYRKDDSFYLRDYPIYTYFARRGFIMAKVDIRGTGSSEGKLPPREYSEQELEDAVEIIEQLSKIPGSNGRVGMWGISWGGFNAIQVAMRQPPALKAILAICASDDLYHDDVHYIDGAYHVDAYELSIDHDNGLPQSPEYELDEDYFQNRFNSYPWFFTYLKNQQDGEFWRKKSLRWNYQKIRIPAYLIGGLLDGYKDSVPRMLENMQAPIKAVIGPWVHSWPDNGLPGPNYEWRHDAVRWWDHWLKGRVTGVMQDPRFTVFLREGHGPDIQLEITPGRWVCVDWPLKDTAWKKYYPGRNGMLDAEPGSSFEQELRYVPSFGISTGFWWGEPTGDMRPDDAGSLTYDSPVLEDKIEIIGFPRVQLRVSASAPLAHWVARLEDVQPDGTVSLVTGAVLNGSQHMSRLEPEYLEPGKAYDIAFDLHFTTWTFHPGHQVRLSLSNALFPMIWPTPYPMTTKFILGEDSSFLELPSVSREEWEPPSFRSPELREQRPDARSLGGGVWPQGRYEVKRDMWTSKVTVEWEGPRDYEIRGRRFLTYEKNYFETNDDQPADSKFQGEAGCRIELEDRRLYLRTTIDLRSDQEKFYVNFTREIFENDILVRKKQWKETFPRRFQ